MRQRSGRQSFLQSTRSPGSITPPTVGATAYDVRSIDDEHLHTESVSISFNPARPLPIARVTKEWYRAAVRTRAEVTRNPKTVETSSGL
jgi:hypothetical protein